MSKYISYQIVLTFGESFLLWKHGPLPRGVIDYSIKVGAKNSNDASSQLKISTNYVSSANHRVRNII